MHHKIKSQCGKYIRSPYFLICVLAVALACLFDTGLQIDEETSLSVLECIVCVCTGRMADSAGIYALPLLLQAGGESFSILIPILTALPSAIPGCLQRQGGNLRSILPRTGIGGYCLSALVAAAVTGGLVLVLGTLLYGVCLLPFFPFSDPWVGMGTKEVLRSLVRKLAGMFLLGGSGVLPAYLLVFFTTNLYLVLCIPFLLRYLMEYAVTWIGVLFFDALYNPLGFLTPGTIQAAVYGRREGLLALLTAAMMGAACCLIGMRCMNRRGGCDE